MAINNQQQSTMSRIITGATNNNSKTSTTNNNNAAMDSHHSESYLYNSAAASASFQPSSVVTLSATKYSLMSLAIMSICVWSAVMVMEPVQCRAMFKPAMVTEQQQQPQPQQQPQQPSAPQQQQQQALLTAASDDGDNNNQDDSKNLAKRSVVDPGHAIRPLEACREFVSAAIARNLAQEIASMFEQNFPNVNDDNEDDNDDDDDDSHSSDLNQVDTSDVQQSGAVSVGKSNNNNNNSNTDQQHKNHHRSKYMWFKLVKQCVQVMAMDLKMGMKTTDFDDLRWLPREKKSWFFGQTSASASSAAAAAASMDDPSESYAKKLDFFWKELQGVRYKKQGGKIIRVNGKMPSRSSKVSRRMILLLLNMSIAKPLLNKIQSQQELNSRLRLQNGSPKTSQLLDDYHDRLRTRSFQNHPLDASSLHSNLIKSDQSIDDTDEQALHDVIRETAAAAAADEEEEEAPEEGEEEDSDAEQSTSVQKTTSSSPSVPNGQMDQSGQSKLVESRQQEMEQPRSKKISSEFARKKDLILRSDPWDKEGIRFKRSTNDPEEEPEESNDELNELRLRIRESRLDKDQRSYPYTKMFGLRYKKSPFDDEGIRYKKSPFDDEGIRYKKSPFDDEGIRYKKSPFDDEGIRYKKSPFDNEGIRYKKSPFDNEGIRYKKSPFDDEHIRY